MSNFQAISWQEHVRFWWDDVDDDVHFVLDQHAELDFYSPSQSLLLLLCAACA
jgi:hypothetical protein